MKLSKSENNEYYRMQNLPYEKFITYGSRALTDSELLAILLRTGTRGISACALGEEVLTRTACFGNGLSGLYHIPLEELKKIDGIGEVKAIQLKTIAELSTRMAQAKAKDGLSFRRPCSVAEYYMERFRHETVEYIVLLLVDSGMHLIEEHILSKGTRSEEHTSCCCTIIPAAIRLPVIMISRLQNVSERSGSLWTYRCLIISSSETINILVLKRVN